MALIHSSLSSTSLWLEVSREHLDQEKQEHQANDAKDDDKDDDGDGHEHVNSGAKVADAVLHLLVFLVASTVDLTVAEQLPPDALRLFCAWAPAIVMVIGCTMLLERGDHLGRMLL